MRKVTTLALPMKTYYSAMLLVYTQKTTPRLTYAFKHIFLRILGVDIKFTSEIESFVAFNMQKVSYGKQPLANELFFQANGLLLEQGIEAIDIQVRDWDGIPAFFSVNEKSAIPFDIFAASFYLLSRYEEYLPHVKDDKGRYPASESLAFQNKFLQLPIVDIWAYKVKELFQKVFPEMVFPKRQLKIHNILSILRPYAYDQKGLIKTTIAYLNDVKKLNFRRIGERTKVLIGARKDPFDTFTWIVNISKRSTSKLTAFFLLGENETYYESFNTYRKKYKLLIKYVGDYKEIGLLYSTSSTKNYNTLRDEIKRMEQITKRSLSSSKQCIYYVNLPENYRNLVEFEIEKDYSMAYPTIPGFRAGTCTPFLFYDLDFEIKTPLLLQPIALTSDILYNKSDADIETQVHSLLNEVRKVNGTFSIVFNNEDFTTEVKNTIWRKLFSEDLQNYE